MKRNRKTKRKLFITLVMLSILSIGLGYAIFTETLTISNSVAISEMKWDVGFSSVADNGGSVLSDSSISSDGKTLTVMCDFGSHTDQETCTAKATIKNNSTFDVGLTQDPTITYDDTYIHTLTFKWNNHPTYENHTVLQDNFIAKGESEEVILTIKTKFMKIDMLPTSDMVIPITITLNFAEWRNGSLPTKNDLAILKSTSNSDATAFRNYAYKSKIKTITFEDEINVPSNAVASWDIGVAQNGNVMAYVVTNASNSSYYDLYIQSDTQLYANSDMSYWFYNMTYVDSIIGLELLDTSITTNMSNMFYMTGYNSTTFTLDLSNFDTSNVTNMSYMFSHTGYNNTTFTLDVSGFDTSKVTNMSSMFGSTGYNSTTFTLDVSGFDTRNVTNMNYMFGYTGYNTTTFTLDVSGFDTSKVTDMSSMFYNTGRSSTTFTLDVSGFDTSNVTDMNCMFSQTGYNSTTFTLDVSGFDTSNVTDMNGMFANTGRSSTTFTLDVSGFDTRNVTNMNYMFGYTGYNSTVFTLDVSGFDTSKVTDMSEMFYQTGYNSLKLNTSITIRNPNMGYEECYDWDFDGYEETCNISSGYDSMFYNVATKTGSKITVNYTSETSSLVDQIIASATGNVVKGVQVD